MNRKLSNRHILQMMEYNLSFVAFIINNKSNKTETLKDNQDLSPVVNAVETALAKAISRVRRSCGSSEANQLLSTFHLCKGELCHLQQVRLDLSRVPPTTTLTSTLDNIVNY